MKLEQYNKCDFIPYDFVETRHIKTSFKKLMKACLPSNLTTDPELGFRKMVEESEWLVQVGKQGSHSLEKSWKPVIIFQAGKVMEFCKIMIEVMKKSWNF